MGVGRAPTGGSVPVAADGALVVGDQVANRIVHRGDIGATPEADVTAGRALYAPTVVADLQGTVLQTKATLTADPHSRTGVPRDREGPGFDVDR